MFNSELWQKPTAAGAAGFYDYQITNSVRFNGTSQALEKTWGSAPSNADAKAISVWIKRTGASGTNSAFGSTTNTKICSADNFQQLEFNTNNPTGYSDSFGYSLPAGDGAAWTARRFRDPSAWLHLVWIYNSDESTATDRIKVYFNGEQTPLSTDTDYWNINTAAQPGSGTDCGFGLNGTEMHIARYWYDDAGWLGCQMADFIMIDGTASISDFGETKNGVWKPVDPSELTFGTNGFWLKFTNASNPGEDFSGNDNDFTNIGSIATHDQMLDSPTFGSSNGGNYCTLNPLNTGSNNTLSEGNLKVTNSSGGCTIMGTMSLVTGYKWYFEARCTGSGNNWIGIIEENDYTDSANTNSSIAGSGSYNTYLYAHSGDIYYGSSSASLGASFTTGDVIGVLVDLESGTNTISFYKDGAAQGSAFNLTGTGINYTAMSDRGSGSGDGFIYNFGQDSSFAGAETPASNTDSSGRGAFLYDESTGGLALCAGNLSAAADPAEDEGPSNYAQALLWTGDADNTRTLTTTLDPDSAWFKNRTTGAATPTRWYNTIKQKYSTTNEYVQFDMDSYGAATDGNRGVYASGATSISIGNVGYINVSGSSYVGYFLGTGASETTDTSGDIDVDRYTNADIGMSIMYYTGSGTSGDEIPHGLGVKPELVIVKNSTSSNSSIWKAWFDKNSYDYNDYFQVSEDEAVVTSGGIFSGNPTTTMLPMANGTTENASSNTYMMWAFASKEGFCKVGTYVGNANADGTFVYLGFSPEIMICKPIVAGNWRIKDIARNTYNPTNETLFLNRNLPEESYAGDYIDFLSNGFKMKDSNSNFNQATTFLYVAWAHNPFKYSLAR